MSTTQEQRISAFSRAVRDSLIHKSSAYERQHFHSPLIIKQDRTVFVSSSESRSLLLSLEEVFFFLDDNLLSSVLVISVKYLKCLSESNVSALRYGYGAC